MADITTCPPLEEASRDYEKVLETAADTSAKNEKQSQHGAATARRETAVIVFVTLTQLVQVYPYGAGIGTSLSIANSFQSGNPHSTLASMDLTSRAKTSAQAAWIAASYPLCAGTFILMGGRLGEIYGHKALLMAGCVWWLIWHLASGFAPSLIALCVMRGLAGIGGAFMVPNAVALLGVTFPPGKKRNLAMGLFGAMAPVGAAGGSFIAAVVVQLTEWKWMFFLATLVGFVVYSAALISVPWDTPVDPAGEIDWAGAYFGVAGLVLFNFVWNQAPSVGWDTPYIYALLIVSIFHIVAFIFWEAKIASSPILPFDIWKSRSFGLLLLMVFCSFMSLGIFLWYFTLFDLTIRGDSMIQNGLNYLPLAIVGTAVAFLAAWLVPRLAAQYIVAIGNGALIVCNVLLATTPAHQTYWAMLFPAIVVAAFTVDLIFASSQIIASGSVGRKNQGVAGSLIGTLLTYGLSTGLGFAGTIEAYTNDGGRDVLGGYRHAVYLGIGLAAVGLIGSVLFLRVEKHTQEGWAAEEPGAQAGEDPSVEGDVGTPNDSSI